LSLEKALEGIWGTGRAVSGPFPCAILDAAREQRGVRKKISKNKK